MTPQEYVKHLRTHVIVAKAGDIPERHGLARELGWNLEAIEAFIAAVRPREELEDIHPNTPIELFKMQSTRQAGVIEFLNEFLPQGTQIYEVVDLSHATDGASGSTSVMDSSYDATGRYIEPEVAALAAGTSEGFGAGGAGAGDAADHVADLAGAMASMHLDTGVPE